MFSTVFTSLTLLLLVISFVFFLTLFLFSQKTFVLINLMQFSQRKFAVTSVINIYTTISELWVHLEYDHLYIPLTFKQGKLQPQTSIFPGSKNPLPIKPAVAWVKIS